MPPTPLSLLDRKRVLERWRNDISICRLPRADVNLRDRSRVLECCWSNYHENRTASNARGSAPGQEKFDGTKILLSTCRNSWLTLLTRLCIVGLMSRFSDRIGGSSADSVESSSLDIPTRSTASCVH